MEQRVICTVCPMGCNVTVVMEGKEVINITGSTCPRGERYARAEVTNPTRILTTTAKVTGAPMLSVKSDQPLPKDKMKEYMEIVNAITLKVPIHIGDIIIEDIDHTGINIIATKNIL